MINYLMRRLLLLPLTLFCIILVNFVIINMAPGDPVTVTEVSPEGGAMRRAEQSVASGGDERYLQFREYYGLTLPILFNLWPEITQEEAAKNVALLTSRKDPAGKPLPFKEYDALRIRFGDQSRYIMPKLLALIEAPDLAQGEREMALRFFVRGGTRQGFMGSNLTPEQRSYNRKVGEDNNLLRAIAGSGEPLDKKAEALRHWYEENALFYRFEPDGWQKVSIFFAETRFFRYFSRVLTLDFGTLRNDPNKTVIKEVSKRFKYSLTLSIIPMLVVFVLCQLFGLLMAYKQNRWQDRSFSLLFLILYALPIFVVAPFLIEKVAVNGHFPFTNAPIPLSGFTSPDAEYEQMLSYQRLLDVLKHICLPLIAIVYGTLAVQSRLARTAVLEVMGHDYVRTAAAKGLSKGTILFKHVGRNAAITIVTALASSLGLILGGSLIVETLFEIDGFGKFFYDAIINRDYNVIMFSALAGSFLSLLGFLAADIAYTLLDPRVTLE